MAGLDHHRHPNRLQVPLQAFRDLTGHALLDLQAAAVHLDQSRHLAQADDPAVRDVAHVDPSIEGQEMMLAQRVHLDVLDQDHVAVGLVEEGVAEDVLLGHVVAVRQVLEATEHGARSFVAVEHAMEGSEAWTTSIERAATSANTLVAEITKRLAQLGSGTESFATTSE